MPCRCLPIAVALALFWTATALAGPTSAQQVEIERMTWLEVRDRLAQGATTVIIPTGGTESNGAHMVTGKHNFIVAETARRIARGLGNALVAPVIAYVPEGDVEARTGHMAYPGTISVPDHVLAGLLEAAAASFKAHGFKTIVLLGDSGANQAPQREVASKLTAAWADEQVSVMNADAYYGGNGGDEWLKSQGETNATIGTHAGIRDTSELMAVLAAGVRLDGAHPDSDGASGDPTRATAERGEHLLRLKVAAAMAEIRDAQQRARSQAAAPGLFGRLYRLLFG
jgi:creatinine amidohydrolase/Fe(II)-dependent formamide hydrolase-like protein